MDICTVDFETGRIVEIGGEPWPPQPKARTENMNPVLLRLRFRLALLVTLALIAAAGAAFFVGDKLTNVQITLLTTLLMALIGEVKASFAFFFDGVAGKDPAGPNDPPPAPLAPPTPES